jgi:hypothetical protein
MEMLDAPFFLPEPKNQDENLSSAIDTECRTYAYPKGTALRSAKGFVNDWVKVTNWIPPVNDSEGH